MRAKQVNEPRIEWIRLSVNLLLLHFEKSVKATFQQLLTYHGRNLFAHRRSSSHEKEVMREWMLYRSSRRPLGS